MGGRMSAGASGARPALSSRSRCRGSREAVTLEVRGRVAVRTAAAGISNHINELWRFNRVPSLPIFRPPPPPHRRQVAGGRWQENVPAAGELRAATSNQRTAERINEGVLVCGTFDLTFRVTW